MMSRSTRSSRRIGVVTVVEPGGAEPFEEPVAAFEVDAEAATHSGVAEGGGDEGLADPDGPHDDGVVAGVDEAQRPQLVQHGAVVGDLGGVVPLVDRHVGVEAGGSGASVGRGGLAAGHFVGQDELEELGVTEPAGLCEGEAFGEGVEAAAELHPAQQRLQLWGDRRGAHRPAPARSANDTGSRIASEAGSGRAWGQGAAVSSRPRRSASGPERTGQRQWCPAVPAGSSLRRCRRRVLLIPFP